MEEPLSGKVAKPSCKMCIVQDFSKQLEKWKTMARGKKKGQKKKKKKQCLDMKSLFAAYSA